MIGLKTATTIHLVSVLGRFRISISNLDKACKVDIVIPILHVRFRERIEKRNNPRMPTRVARQPWNPIICDGVRPYGCGTCALNPRRREGEEGEGQLRERTGGFLNSACCHGLPSPFFPLFLRLFGWWRSYLPFSWDWMLDYLCQ